MGPHPAELPKDYYDFGTYVDRQRWLTYFHQLKILLPSRPKQVLEIGLGPGIVRAVLLDRGCSVTTVDINPDLRPDYVGDLTALPLDITDRQWEWVICSRVLHHVAREELPIAIAALSELNTRRTLLTVPREDLSVQFTMRRTAGRAHSGRVSGGATLKRILRRRLIRSEPSGRWMLDGNQGVPRSEFNDLLASRFNIEEHFVLADDPAHVFFVLAPKT